MSTVKRTDLRGPTSGVEALLGVEDVLCLKPLGMFTVLNLVIYVVKKQLSSNFKILLVPEH